MASAIARRYAAACLAVARERDLVEPVGADLERARSILGDPRVRTAMTNPRVTVAERTDLLAGLLEGISAPVRNLVRLLVDHRRFALLDDVIAAYSQLVDAASGVLHAVVSSAAPLDPADARRIERALTGRFGKPVRLEPVHDPEILGGLVIRVGDQVIDDSVRTHLRQLQASMA